MTEQLTPCCAKFAEASGSRVSMFSGRYPVCPDSQIEHDAKDRNWNVNGCCGGGCYVITALIFCPWCGSRLPGTESLELPRAPVPK